MWSVDRVISDAPDSVVGAIFDDPHHRYRMSIPTSMSMRADQWCEDNCQGIWNCIPDDDVMGWGKSTFSFPDCEDYMMFKLRFTGTWKQGA